MSVSGLESTDVWRADVVHLDFRGPRDNLDACVMRHTGQGFLSVAIIAAVALSTLSAACDPGLGTRGGLVDNSTTQDLVVEVVGDSEVHRLEIPAQASRGSTAGRGECLGTGVALYTPDGELLTMLGARICDGRTLVIDDEDLPSDVPEPGSRPGG